ncbi:MAG: hypothetical protein PHS51_14540 [Gallionella sp.]|nr:hypothetical protein [Gallionella sp.]
MSISASTNRCSVQSRPPQRRPVLLRSYRPLTTSVPAPQPVLTHPTPVAATQVVLQVTILPALLHCLQQAVAKSCGKVVETLSIEPVPRTQSIRVRLAVAGSSVNAAMEAIIRALPSGEIGRIATF